MILRSSLSSIPGNTSVKTPYKKLSSELIVESHHPVKETGAENGRFSVGRGLAEKSIISTRMG
jgi:hypothetical protein